MAERSHGTRSNGKPFDSATVEAVWKKGREIEKFSPDVWRHDRCGNVMKRTDHGDTKSKYGWEIDHEKPVSKGGTDDLNNLQPLQWEDNRTKGDTYPWKCP